jgi:hypothetical protein
MPDKLQAVAKYMSGGSSHGSRAQVPSEVRDMLGAEAGDMLIFEKGSMHAAEAAALKGTYLVVRFVRAQEQQASPLSPPPAPLQPDSEAVTPAPIESLADAVRKKQEAKKK